MELFEIGKKVRLLKDGGGYKAGDIVEICDIDSYMTHQVRNNKVGSTWWFQLTDLEEYNEEDVIHAEANPAHPSQLFEHVPYLTNYYCGGISQLVKKTVQVILKEGTNVCFYCVDGKIWDSSHVALLITNAIDQGWTKIHDIGPYLEEGQYITFKPTNDTFKCGSLHIGGTVYVYRSNGERLLLPSTDFRWSTPEEIAAFERLKEAKATEKPVYYLDREGERVYDGDYIEFRLGDKLSYHQIKIIEDKGWIIGLDGANNCLAYPGPSWDLGKPDYKTYKRHIKKITVMPQLSSFNPSNVILLSDYSESLHWELPKIKDSYEKALKESLKTGGVKADELFFHWADIRPKKDELSFQKPIIIAREKPKKKKSINFNI